MDKIIVQLNYNSLNTLKMTYERDIVNGGIYFTCGEQFSTDTQLSFVLNAPTLFRPMEISGSVVHVHELGSEQFGIGVVLDALTPEQKEKFLTLKDRAEQESTGKGSQEAESQSGKEVEVVIESAKSLAARKAGRGAKQHMEQQAKKLFTQSREQIVRGNLKAAMQKIQQALDLQPNDPQYRKVLRELKKKTAPPKK